MKNGPLVHDQFSRLTFETAGFLDNTWMGVPIIKCPFDTHMYQEIIHRTRPDLIVETGAFMGGSALYMANVCDLLDHGRVLSVELVTDRPLPNHPRVDFLLGMSSTDPVVIEHVAKHADGKRTMVILDSAHNRKHVLREMELYHGFVSKGCYLIVEDTNVHGYASAPQDITEDGGPAEAVRDWQPRNKGFEVDRGPERLRMSFNPGGYLRRVR
jgi:cephalosporin hydroxylase